VDFNDLRLGCPAVQRVLGLVQQGLSVQTRVAGPISPRVLKGQGVVCYLAALMDLVIKLLQLELAHRLDLTEPWHLGEDRLLLEVVVLLLNLVIEEHDRAFLGGCRSSVHERSFPIQDALQGLPPLHPF